MNTSSCKFHEHELVQPTPHLDQSSEYMKNDRSDIARGEALRC